MPVFKLTPLRSASQLRGQAWLLSLLVLVAVGFGSVTAPQLRSLLATGEPVFELRQGEWVRVFDQDVRFQQRAKVSAGWRVEGNTAIYLDQKREQVGIENLALLSIAALPDSTVVSVGEQGLVVRRDRDGRWLRVRSGGPTLRTLAVTPDGGAYAAGDRGTLVRLGEHVDILTSGRGFDITELRVSADAKRFFAKGTHPGEGSRWLNILLLVVSGLLFIAALILAALRWRFYWRSAAFERAWSNWRAEVDLAGPGEIAYSITGVPTRAMSAPKLEVSLLTYDLADGGKRLLSSTQADGEATTACAPKDPLVVLGLIEPAAPAEGVGKPSLDVELVLEVVVNGTRIQGVLP